eukprot:COSAG04_NODE_145_length_22925_cov_10.043459_9_plen_91_part_00
MIAAGLVLASAAALRAAAPHNGGFAERLVEPAAGTKPHVLWLLIDDYGWAELGAHRSPPSPCAPHGHPLASPRFRRCSLLRRRSLRSHQR